MARALEAMIAERQLACALSKPLSREESRTVGISR
jgi:hypothetical protein